MLNSNVAPAAVSARGALAAHEAGHAIAAHHYGLKIKSLGLEPVPHVLIRQAGATTDEVGALLAAGAAATYLLYDRPMGHETDFAMAAKLGDLDGFVTKAYTIIVNNWEQFLVYESYLYGGDAHHEAALPGTDAYEEVMAVIDKAQTGVITLWLLNFMARLQFRHPGFMVKLAGMQVALAGGTKNFIRGLTPWRRGV